MKKVFLFLFLMAVLVVDQGCTTTVVPKKATDGVASWDGNKQNSGAESFTEDHSVVISARTRKRYNLLIEKYGDRFAIPLKQDDGITPGPGENFTIDPQHAVYFQVMNQWRKEGK